jgi:hypothetical protein
MLRTAMSRAFVTPLSIALWATALLCSSTVTQSTPPDTLPSFQDRTDLIGEIVKNDLSQDLVLRGRTNLPVGTRLSYCVRDKKGNMPQRKCDYVDVGAGGVFETKPLSANGPIPSGEYEVEVRTLFAEVMPDSVKAVIGKSGENLRGPLIDQSRGAPMLATAIPFSIGGEQGRAEQRQRRSNQVAIVNDVLRGFDALHKSLQTYVTFKRNFDAKIAALTSRIQDAIGDRGAGAARSAGLQLEYLPTALPGCAVEPDAAYYQEIERDYQKYMAEARAAIL